MMLTEDQVSELHALYTRLTGLEVTLTLFRSAAWQAWARQVAACIRQAEQPGLTLRIALQTVIEHRKAKWAQKKFTLAATLRFGYLVERVDYFEEDLAEALHQRRVRSLRPDPARAAVLQATGRAPAAEAPASKATPEVVAKLISDLKNAVK